MEAMIYLFFKSGRCEEAMRFYAETLGGEILSIAYNSSAPDEQSRMPGGDDMVMNMAMKLGNSVMMASDTPDAYYQTPQGYRVCLAPDTIEDVERVYAALSAGGEVTMPLGETFWSERFAMFTDRYGTHWMINFTGSRATG